MENAATASSPVLQDKFFAASAKSRFVPLTDDFTAKILRHRRMTGLVKLRCSA